MVNRAFAEMLGYRDVKELLRLNFHQHICTDTTSASLYCHPRTQLKSDAVQAEIQLRRHDGTYMTARVSESAGSTPNCVDGFVENISGLREAEKKLRLALKMDAVGQLAAGVAHDFNNILNMIGVYAELLATETLSPNYVRTYAEEIFQGTHRGKSLTEQLLALDQNRPSKPEILGIDDLLRPFKQTLPRLLGRAVECRIVDSRDRIAIRVDRSQWDQIILNLAINARDSMPEGGVITIEAKWIPAEPGDDDTARSGYLDLLIADTGVGMDENTLLRVFEPYFTTKERGKGTGLGLTLVFKTIAEIGGSVSISSALGRGTNVRILVPAVDPLNRDCPNTEPALDGGRSSGTILFLANKDRHSAAATNQLRSKGFCVLEARDLAEAEKMAKAREHKLSLVLVNSSTLKQDATSILRCFQRIAPNLSVVFVSRDYQDIQAVGPEQTLVERFSEGRNITMEIQKAVKALSEESIGCL